MTVNIQFTGRVSDLLKEIRQSSQSEFDKGTKFEALFCKVAPSIAELEVEKIWRWGEWPALQEHGYDAKDIGIDLVAELKDGKRVAIQCKCYAENYNVSKSDIQSFVVAANPENFPLRWFVATCNYSGTAEKLLKQNQVRTIDFLTHGDLELTKDSVSDQKHNPRKLQQRAIDAVIQGFKDGNRGRLIMACGTGKTFTALRIAEELAPDRAKILFIAPSIALVAQARREWLRHTRRRLACTVICSDGTAGRNSSEDISHTEISCAVTTDPKKIADELNVDLADDVARVVFCTYQSLNKLRDAQHEHGAPGFDLALVDEAHRTTGYLDEDRAGLFQLIHKADQIRSDRRLYMTATPRIYDTSKSKKDDQAHVVDMNDEEQYGPEFYRLTFKEAVEKNMLCDYRVIALGVAEDTMDAKLNDVLLELNDDIGGVGKAADAQAFLALGAIGLAINGFVEGPNEPGILARTIGYASNIRRSKWFADALRKTEIEEWIASANQNSQVNVRQKAVVSIQAEHLDGTSSALQRNNALRNLHSEASEQSPRLISNAQLFTEGVDVPSLNAIAFLDPRQSKVDTIQAVGRVMRRDEASGKVFGYIIVPVILPPGANLIKTLEEDQSRFKSLGTVLRALQSHDERLYTELSERLTFATMNRALTKSNRPPSEDYSPDPGLQLTLLDKDAKQMIYAQIAKKVGLAQRGKIIADAITQAIEKAAHLFEMASVTQVIAKTIGTPSDNDKESCKTAALLIVNACIMHKRLEETGNLGGLTGIASVNSVHDRAGALSGAWRTILEKDFAPIFADATALLENLPQNDNTKHAIGALIQCAIDNATTLNELGFDHAGPLYHRVLGTAQSDGAFYTKNLSGYLLAGLAFDKDFTDWRDPQKVESLRIIDPACGTGTLLMAALNIIKKRAAEAQNLDATDTAKLHKKLVENSIHGTDINKYSIQLAACNLTIGAPDTDYAQINLHTLQHGPIDGTAGDSVRNVRHGALEKLMDEDINTLVKNPPLFGELLHQPLLGEDLVREKKRVAMPSVFDAVIYNPPFTETENQNTKFNEKTKLAMRERLQLIKTTLEQTDPKAAQAIGKRTVRPFFTPLTCSLLSANQGKLAKILPATAMTSENGRTERQYLADNFHIELVVTSHDPKHVNFSENTAIHECLVIGTCAKDNRKPTRFIQLARYPNDVKAAEELIDAINSGDARELYSETTWPADKIRVGDWTPVQWYNPHLAHAAAEIDRLPKLIAIEDICSISNAPITIRVNFDYAPDDNGDVFCTIAEDTMQTIQAQPESKATPKKGKTQSAEALWTKATRLLIASRFSTSSSRLLAIHSKKPALGSAYYAVAAQTPDQEKAFAAFLNSSFGIIQMLNRRTRKLTYPRYEVGHLKTLMLPDPNKVDLTPLLKAFEKVKDMPLGRLADCAEDPARKILDDAAAKTILLDPPPITDQWREWLSQEPTITNKYA